MKITANNISLSWLSLANICFVLNSGEALLIRGKNGIGKSSLLKSLLKLLPYESGSVTKIENKNCHYLAHENAMKSLLSVGENLKFYGGNKKKINSALKKLSIENLANVTYGLLSKGEARKVALVRLLLVAKKIWLLDEPFAGLDKTSKENFTKIMNKHLENGGIIILVNHEKIKLTNMKVLQLEKYKGQYHG